MKPPLSTLVLLPLGTLLQHGSYRLEQLLSHGEWDLTYQATHLPSQTQVLITTLNIVEGSPQQVRSQQQGFLNLAQKFLPLKHRSLQPFRQLFVESNLPFLVRDYIAGQTLEMVAKEAPIAEERAITLIQQIAQGLALLHDHQLQHGNIQPINIVLRLPSADPVLINPYLGPQTCFTKTEQSPHHAALEQYYQQASWTAATDIYSLAATLYTLVTGQMPIAAHQRHRTPLLEPQKLQPHLTQRVSSAILQGMALLPQQRCPSISEWLSLLPTARSNLELSNMAGLVAESGTIAPDSKLPTSASVTLSQTQPTQQQGSKTSAVETSTVETSAAETPAAQTAKAAAPLPAVADHQKISAPVQSHPPASPGTELDPSTPAAPHPPAEPTRLVIPSQPQPQVYHHRFPRRALIISAILSGILGLAFGLLLRFHYQNQFARPDSSAPLQPVKNEPFLPKPTSSGQEVEIPASPGIIEPEDGTINRNKLSSPSPATVPPSSPPAVFPEEDNPPFSDPNSPSRTVPPSDLEPNQVTRPLQPAPENFPVQLSPNSDSPNTSPETVFTPSPFETPRPLGSQPN
ncbi:MAG: protein kinase [Acaryochloridaceae cyanobacterium SU_2_1]|nr:protein kinase [Acaryochloridaceae cyanobacterium SU_2_1]